MIKLDNQTPTGFLFYLAKFSSQLEHLEYLIFIKIKYYEVWCLICLHNFRTLITITIILVLLYLSTYILLFITLFHRPVKPTYYYYYVV